MQLLLRLHSVDFSSIMTEEGGRTDSHRESMPRDSTHRLSLIGRNRRQSSMNSIPRNFDRRFIRYENTFRMEPDDDRRIDIAKVKRIGNMVVDSAIKGYQYDPNNAKMFTSRLSEQIRNQMKQLPANRFKFITHVCLGQKKNQDLRVASRCLWDLKCDRHITITKETKDYYVTITIFCVYSE
ncbi:unnamed protein product [Didymodactylos carnosus]|uniref:Dynein light chain n=1 Tax=Didymodactylos carnosus TaxID=1234261 RepID=A0A814ADY6_9BILA|nr:unnamed protein product [Didymodactylos carnosus]CAF0911293.1 unnamed protein product [Didymodactylos carnosus]CAF3611993.1 unnamed protein product [Didymodactylos carnosus]CAF3692338.1 unnamed protein product [Didymodactylos carnosus]